MGKIALIGIWTGMCVFSGYNANYHVAELYKDTPNVINMPLYETQFQVACDYLSENGIEELLCVQQMVIVQLLSR